MVAPGSRGLTGTYKGEETTMTGKANETWAGDKYKTGGGATWLGGTYDPETKLVFFGTGNPAPWNPGCVRATTSGPLRASPSIRKTAS